MRRRSNHSTIRLTFERSRRTFNHMVELSAPQLSHIFHALSDSTRRRMLLELASGERTVGQLAQPFAISLAAASKHIKVLESAGLIQGEVRGRAHLCRLDPGPLASAHEWLSFYERFWTIRLDVLDRLLREEEASEAGSTGNSPSPENETPTPREGEDQ
jgi:DNA-binding transcriptional ArsR family regulator